MNECRNGFIAAETTKVSIDESMTKPETDSEQGYDGQEGILDSRRDKCLERRLRRKLECHVLPLLACMYLLK